jgi:hypothetical protein
VAEGGGADPDAAGLVAGDGVDAGSVSGWNFMRGGIILGSCPAQQRRILRSPFVKPIAKSSKLANVCYDIRGPVLDKARQMEEEGHKIIKLNIGNLAAFGLSRPTRSCRT